MALAAMGAPDAVGAKLNYQDANVQRTLVSNGRIYTRRDGSGTDGQIFGAAWDHVGVQVQDARRLAPAASLDVHGFEFRKFPTRLSHEDFYDESHLFGLYFQECVDLVRQSTGASVVKVFDYNLRSVSGSASGAQVAGGNTRVQPPAQVVHNDYTLTSAPARLRQLGDTPKLNDVSWRIHGERPLLSEAEVQLAQGKRFSIVNVWRNIREDPVQVMPLACCDARSVVPDDLCVFEIHYTDRVGENYFAAHSPRHAWYYYPLMAREEALLIKQWDSQGSLAGGSGAVSTFSLHTAFHDATTPPSAPDRESVEVRCLCIHGEPEARL